MTIDDIFASVFEFINKLLYMVDYCGFTDLDLMTCLKDNDENCFRYLFDYYYMPVKSNIEQFVNDRAVAEDIVQEVFIAFWLQRSQLPNDLKIEGWLFTVSHNKSISYVRKRLKTMTFSSVRDPFCQDKVLALSTLDDIDLMDREDQYARKVEQLQTGIMTLSPQTKKAFLLYKIQGYSYEEISEQLGVSVQSAKQYVKNAMKCLKRYTELHYKEISVIAYIVLKSWEFTNGTVVPICQN